MNKIIPASKVAELIKDGDTVMIGGFLSCGTPHKLIDEVLKSGKSNLTVICNDSGFAEDTAHNKAGIGRLIVNKQVSHVMTSHIGTNKETGRQMNNNETKVTLVPQGTLAEQIRAAGCGLGGILTPTGLGTEVEIGKDVLTIDGKKFILEKPLKANVALVKGAVVDKKGNIRYEKTERNFNPLMAMAADIVIVEATKIVEVGEIDPEAVVTSHIFIDYIVEGGM
ncbi:MAG: CoA transferase subunit A [Candidatus Delongbacteria bacterium]|nr:CoA transferase subunit A [Candidatus Delongbacteria bacterium]MBN2833504.1 CoA transferase subunit A [Candidatus Delongbacteria bacterium]